MLDNTFLPMEDYIRGEVFESISTRVPNAIYSKIDHAPYFLTTIAPRIDFPFVFVTHNGDNPVSNQLVSIAERCSNLKRWFGSCVEADQHPLVRSLPMGLENDRNFPHLKKRQNLAEACLRASKKSPSKLLYMNYSFYTKREERTAARDCAIGNLHKGLYTDRCVESIHQDKFNDWLDEMIDHHYVLCPRGNGADSHRLWEVLYAGRIPVVRRDNNMSYYEDLPILMVDDWCDLNEDLLVSNLDRISDPTNFVLDKLRMSWWVREIGEEGNRIRRANR